MSTSSPTRLMAVGQVCGFYLSVGKYQGLDSLENVKV